MKTLFKKWLAAFKAGNTTGTYYHYFAGFLITFITAFILYHYFGVTEWTSIFTGIAAGVVTGALKELVWDKTLGWGTPNKGDFFDTFWGVAVGFVAILGVIECFLK